MPSWAKSSPLMPVPDSASGPVFVRRQDLEIHLNDKVQAQYLGDRIKLLQPSALQLGNISITWNPASGAPIVHEITVYRDGQPIDVLKSSTFEILRREDQLEQARLDGNLTAILRIPDLRVGDELEVDLTTFDNDPTLLQSHSGVLQLAPIPSPGRYHIELSWDDRPPNLRMTADMTAAMLKGDRQVEFRFDNPSVLSPPKDAPGRYQWQRILEYSDFPNWSALSRRLAPLYSKAATLAENSTLKQEASRIGAMQASQLGRASAALKLVQQDVRYIYVGLNGGNLTPASADETWQRRYGDCKAKTALLLALLAQLGIEAEPVLINSSGADDGFDQRLPTPALFDHVMVRAHIDGNAYWLDGTLPAVASPSDRPAYPVRWVLPLTARGSDVDKLPEQTKTTPDEIHLIEIDARAGFDKPARIVSTDIVRGIKGLKQEVQFSSVTSDQLLAALRQASTGGFFQTIDDVKWHYDQQARASILTITGNGTIDWNDDGNGARSYALPGGGFNPPERRSRERDQSQTAPFYSQPEYTCDVTTVRLPNSTQARQWSSKPSYDQQMFGRAYHRAWELRDGAIRMVRGYRVEQSEIDPTAAQLDNARIASFDNSMAWISYDPSGQKASVGNGEKVPATYELDWTSTNVPCLSPVSAHSISN